MPFGPHTIPGNQVVFASEHTYVTVNRKPVLPYHLLVIPKRRSARRLRDLNAQENADFFNCVSKAQALAGVVPNKQFTYYFRFFYQPRTNLVPNFTQTAITALNNCPK